MKDKKSNLYAVQVYCDVTLAARAQSILLTNGNLVGVAEYSLRPIFYVITNSP